MPRLSTADALLPIPNQHMKHQPRATVLASLRGWYQVVNGGTFNVFNEFGDLIDNVATLAEARTILNNL